MDIDVGMVDHVLTTTRAVRRRLDLERDVPDQVLYDCIDVAEQAPTGGNLGSRRWIIIRDQETKDRLAELYLRAGGGWVIETAERLAGTGHHNERMMQGAAHLARHLAEVPVLVIPTILGRHDGSGRPGLFDSVIQAGWSFMLALRARGLGTTWTTMFLNEADAVADLLGIPDDVTQICLFPVAYTIGTEFKPSPKRLPARDITFVDHYGITRERSDHADLRLADGPGTFAEVDSKARPDAIWDLVVDLDTAAAFSDEYLGGTWHGEPGPGATFTGRNRLEGTGEWEVLCHVTEWDPPHRFAWHTNEVENPGARWRYTIEQIPGGTRLRHDVRLGPGWSGLVTIVERNPEAEPSIVADRLRSMRRNMVAVVEGIRDRAEAGGASGGDDPA